ncbi:MAG: hypothetical protein JNM30_12995 [Rhodospirillales bacterium]|nr:hypothetical protein [Rhodospirillales bacterium]
MPEGLTVFLDSLLAYVGVAADYLLAHQAVLNLVLVFSTCCLSILAIAAYVRPREIVEPAIRVPERRPYGSASLDAQRPGDPKLDTGPGPERDDMPPAPAPVQATVPLGPNDTGHRLSRLEESFLQLNRDLTELEDTTKDMKQEIEILGMRLRQPTPYDQIDQQIEPPPPLAASVAIGTDLVAAASSGALVQHQEFGAALERLADMAQRVDELSSAVESQRRTVLAIGQVVAQMPDWRKLKPVLVDSLEQIAAATDQGSRRLG